MNTKNSGRWIIPSISAIILSLSCGPGQPKVEKITEDGIEVVINRRDPYQMKGEPSSFELQKEVTIDTEGKDLAELGISRIRDVNVDRDGNVYFIRYSNSTAAEDLFGLSDEKEKAPAKSSVLLG